MAESRVVSLIASSTEIVCALGYADLLVARSHECDYPEWVKELPQVTEPRIRTDAPNADIDQQVRTIVREGLSVYRVDAERLKQLEPDVIITQDHCEVCAVSTKDVEAAVCDWLDRDVRIVSLKPNALSDVFDGMVQVADALGDRSRGERLVERLRGRMEEIRARARAEAHNPRVAFIEWVDPLMAGGNWMPELIERAGGLDVLGRAGEHSGWIEFERLCEADPDLIVVAPCGLDLERTTAEMPALTSQPGYAELNAVRNGRVFVADGNAYFNRPGPRLVQSLEILAELIHPDVFRFGHEGGAWQQLATGNS